MNPVEAALRRVAADLDGHGCSWALVGGLAVSVRAEPRTTRDVDIAVGVQNDAEAEQLLFALQNAGYRVTDVIEQSAAGRLATARTVPPAAEVRGVLIDLLFASTGVEVEIVGAADRLEIVPALTVPVARIGHLIAMKILARDDRRRPQDWDDIRALRAEATPEDIENSRALLTLIEARGFSRGRALVADLDTVLAELSA